jgi:hypothetical protein
MAGVVAKLAGQVLGIAKGSSTGPFTIVTTTSNAPGAAQNPHAWPVLSQSFLTQLSIGAPLTVYVVFDSADITAIEGAVTVVPLDGVV